LDSQGGEGGGIFFFEPGILTSQPGATGFVAEVILTNTILAQNQAATGPDCFNVLNSFGFNLFGTDAGCTIFGVDPSDKLNIPPELGPLQDNGGPTFTHGLMETSPAIDMGNDSIGCQAPDFNAIINSFDFTNVDLLRDQRNFPRPIAVLDPTNPICDIGAFEFQVFDFTVTKDDGLNGATIPVGTVFDYTITVTNNGPGSATAVTLNDSLPAGMSFGSVTPSQGTCTGGAVISCDLGDLALGATATITVTVTATATGTFTNIATITLNNPFQQQLTKTAQVTTTVGGEFVEGSGFHCDMQHGTVNPSPRFVLALGLMSLLTLGVYMVLRRRTNE
jgi:uncharacterized repeat protein (TIGR01451 family)